MTALPDWDIVSDAELACAAAGGDRAAFARIYDRYADRLHDFCVGMVRDRDAAADCVQDVFCAAATRLSQLRDADKLRPWLYAIARNEALRCIKQRRREQVSEEIPDLASADPGPETLAARSELAELIAEAAGGLSDRDRTALELAYRHGLDGPELAQALGVSTSNANNIVGRLRQTIERSLGALLVSRRAQDNPSACPELGEILASWDGKFTVLMRKRISRHIESCSTCEEERRRLVSPAALLGGVPVFIPAPSWLRDYTLNHVQLTSSSTPLAASRADDQAAESAAEEQPTQPGNTIDRHGIDDSPARHLPRVRLVTALLAATLMICAGLTFGILHHHQVSITPANLNGTTTTRSPSTAPLSTATTITTTQPAPPPAPPTSNSTPLPPPEVTTTANPTPPEPSGAAPVPITPATPAATQCPDGSAVPADQPCLPPPQQVTCWDGSTVVPPKPCPPQVPQTPQTPCWDGSTVVPPKPCPPQVPQTPQTPQTTCWDGSTVVLPKPCPPKVTRTSTPATQPQ